MKVENNPNVITSEGLLALKQLPRKLIVIRGGYIGVEFASIHANFGSQVTRIQNGSRFLPREDADIAEAVKANLESRGVQILTSTERKSVVTTNGQTAVTVARDGETMQLEADKVLIATGRRPNTDGLRPLWAIKAQFSTRPYRASNTIGFFKCLLYLTDAAGPVVFSCAKTAVGLCSTAVPN